MAKKRIDEEILFNAALKEFSTRNFEEASLNRIISTAGVTKGSFYYRFSNKFDLYLFLIKEANRRKWEFINSDLTKTDKTSDIFDLFKKQAESGIRFASAFPDYYALSRMFSKEKGNPVYKRVLDELKTADETGLKQIIKAAYDSGSISNHYSYDFIEKVIPGLFHSFDEIFFTEKDLNLNKSLSYLSEYISFMRTGFKRH